MRSRLPETTLQERWIQVGLIFLSAIAVVMVVAVFGYLIRQPAHQTALTLHAGVALMVLTYLAAVRWIERRAPSEFSLRHALPELAGGVPAGIALISLVMAILWVVGVYLPDGWGAADAFGLAYLFAVFVSAAVLEEILYRGLLFRLCSTIIGTWGALLLSAAIFGGVHAFNPGATAAGVVSTALAGVLLGAVFVATRRLWLPIGLHTGWNFGEGAIFGTPVSGSDVVPGAIAGTLKGPDILTGGRYGPEASIVAVVVLTAASAYSLWRIARLRRAEAPIWADDKGPVGPHLKDEA